jgi:hypothetical protein
MPTSDESSPGTSPDQSGSGAGAPTGHRHISGKTRAIYVGAAVAVIAVGTAVGLVFSSSGRAHAASHPAWAMTAGNIQQMSQQNSSVTSHFFNTAASFGAGASLVKTPVQAGYATTPVLSYTSYAQFSSDIQNNNISYPYQWVMYDPEDWSQTPVDEQQDPIKYMKLFVQLAHANGLKVIMAPALDLGSVSGSLLPRNSGESIDQWYVRVNIAGAAAAAGANVFILQDESNTTNLAQYDSLYNSVAAQVQAAHPATSVYSEVSTANGTAQQMAAAVESIGPDGFYVATPSAAAVGVQFFQLMQSAGY